MKKLHLAILHILAAVCILAFGTVANAADVTFSVTTAAGTRDLAKTLTNAQMDRLIAYSCAVYYIETTNNNGTPGDLTDDFQEKLACTTNGQKAQYIDLWLANQWTVARDTIRGWEKARDSKAASDAVAPLE